jgi:hypothetical protein
MVNFSVGAEFHIGHFALAAQSSVFVFLQSARACRRNSLENSTSLESIHLTLGNFFAKIPSGLNGEKI